MRPPESFIGQPVRSLQIMLQVIAQNEPDAIVVIPDGIYGPETIRAVTAFQRKHMLPVTGITDLATWEAIVAVYDRKLNERDTAPPIEVIWNPNFEIGLGCSHPNLCLVQGILRVLSDVYHSVSAPALTGVLDAITSDSLASFQMLSGLPVTGKLDSQTWASLSRQYPLAANRATATGNIGR